MIAAPSNLAPRPRVSPPRTYRGSTPLAARGESPAVFDRRPSTRSGRPEPAEGRCIPNLPALGHFLRGSNTAGILPLPALPGGCITGLGATRGFHHGLLIALVAAHLLDHVGQTPATPPTLRRRRQPGKGTRGQTGPACGHESFEVARRDRNQLGDRSAAIRDGHDFTFSGVRDNGRSVLLQCTYANRFHVLHCSRTASHAI